MSNNKQEISIDRVKQIVKEELQKYVQGNLSEENLRKTIQSQLEKSGQDIVFKQLGLRRDSWKSGWELNGGYGGLNEAVKRLNIYDIGEQVIKEIIKDVTPEDVLASLNKQNIQSLKKVYREVLMDYFTSRVREFAQEHGREQAEKLFKEYLFVEQSNQI